MTIKPIVRYMLLCDDWQIDAGNSRRVIIEGLISNIHAVDDPPYPLAYKELCVFLALTECYGQGHGKIACIFADSGQKIFETRPQLIQYGPDPLEVIGVPFRIRDAIFPYPGLYMVQFWYEDELVEERPLRMR